MLTGLTLTVQVNDEDIKFFTSVLSERGVLVDPHEIEPHNTDWLRKFSGQTKLVLKPTTTQEVSEGMLSENTALTQHKSSNIVTVASTRPLFCYP
jgi:hypothetical protein